MKIKSSVLTASTLSELASRMESILQMIEDTYGAEIVSTNIGAKDSQFVTTYFAVIFYKHGTGV